MVVLWIGFIVTYAVVLTCVVLAVKWLHGRPIYHLRLTVTNLLPANSFDKQLDACTVTAKPNIVAVVWAALVSRISLLKFTPLTEHLVGLRPVHVCDVYSQCLIPALPPKF